jgi:hypothetical protein
MTGSNKSKTTSTSTDSLTKASPNASVELSEAALGEASGGAVFPSMPATSLKLDPSLKIGDHKATDPNFLVPAVQKP